ncbi:MAG: FkbM family methyltransferase [Chloroflexota bacterium]
MKIGKTKPTRLALAQKICRATPPIIAQKLRLVLYPQGQAIRDDYESVVRAQTGSLFPARTGELHGYVFSVHGFYEWRNTAIAIAVAAKGDTIVEIGANIGTETIGFSDIVGEKGKVYAFEPLPSNLEALEDLKATATFQNIDVVPVALSDGIRTASFVIPPSHQTGIGHVISNEGMEDSQTIAINCMTLDAYIDQIGPTRLIAIDTEGEEVRVLRGGRKFIRRYEPFIILEASSRHLERSGFSIQDLDAEIRGLDYNLYSINKIGLSKIESGKYKNSRNWLCIPKQQEAFVKKIHNILVKSALMPSFHELNPMHLTSNV